MKHDQEVYDQARREMVQDILKYAAAVELGGDCRQTHCNKVTARLRARYNAGYYG